MGELQQYTQSIVCIPFSQNLNNKDKKKQWEKTKKQKNEQPWTLGYTLVFQIMSFLLSVFYFGPNQLVSLQNDAK
jgi:hypothetical protein